ncbi:lysyl-tRNA synthetase, partial [Vibrio parahaemolyticus AQ3810]
QRATLIAAIRQFFAERQVMEVDTPAMSHATVTDIHLHTFQTEFVGRQFAKRTRASSISPRKKTQTSLDRKINVVKTANTTRTTWLNTTPEYR